MNSLKIVSLTAYKNNSDYSAIKIKGGAEAEEKIYYKYSVYLNGELKAENNYCENNIVKWSPKETGKYILKLQIKNSKGKIVSKNIEYNYTS